MNKAISLICIILLLCTLTGCDSYNEAKEYKEKYEKVKMDYEKVKNEKEKGEKELKKMFE